MTGPEHYRKGEELLAEAERMRRMADGFMQDDLESHKHADALLTEASVHFQAAAVAIDGARGADRHMNDWARAVGTYPHRSMQGAGGEQA